MQCGVMVGKSQRTREGSESRAAGKRHNGLRKDPSLSMYGPEALEHHTTVNDLLHRRKQEMVGVRGQETNGRPASSKAVYILAQIQADPDV